MKLLKSIMINCQESTLLSSKAVEQPLSLSEKFKQRIHLMLCKPCKFFSDQIRMIHTTLKSVQNDRGIQFSVEKKQALQEKINTLK